MLLAVASALDTRLRPPSEADADVRAKAWAAALDDDMTTRYARDAVVAHYAESEKSIMPADLNRAWRAYRSQMREAERRRLDEVEKQRQELLAVPMPDAVREQMRRIIQQRKVPSDDAR